MPGRTSEGAVMGCPNSMWWSCSPACILKVPTPSACNLKFPTPCSHKIPTCITICMEKLHRLIENPFFLSPIRIAEGNNLLHGEEMRQKKGDDGGLATAQGGR
jgi:hypothetical protein